MELVLGVDVGGTASRALVATLDGERVGYGRAGAGNPVAVPRAVVQANVRQAVSAALSDIDASKVVAAVVGAAGAGGSDVFDDLLAPLGISCPLLVVGDVVVAFAAGTRRPRGTVLIAGTGAVAATIDGLEKVRVADGLGWLLGDLGSGFWLGREAAAATARWLAAHRSKQPAVPRNGPFTSPRSGPFTSPHSGPLTELVAEAIGERDPDRFVVAVHARPPRELAALAPLVTGAALAGDPTALSIVDRAVSHLTATVAEIRDESDPTPIVLAGGVLAHSAPIHGAVRARLAARWPAADLLDAGPGEVGAVRLAIRARLGGIPPDPAG
jgi:N-acetylglucosamine kinase-like BadF-type ATPase